MKLQEVLSEYQFRNVGQFRAIAESLGYAQEYNKGILHFTRSDDELRIDLEKIRSYTKHEPEMIRLNSSMDHVCTFFDREQSSSSEYRDILKKEGIDIVNWGDLKDDEKDRFTIIDHKNKICYTGKELYEYALQNGYILDGKGTQLEKGVMSGLTDIEGRTAKIRLTENGISVFYRKEALVIPDSIYGKKLTKKQKDDLVNGNVIVLSSKKGDIMLQVDKDLNSVIVRSEKELSIPAQIGGYKLTAADKYLLANGYSLENKLMRSPKGEYIIADVTMTPDKKGYQFSNIQTISETKAKELLQRKLEVEKEHVISPEKEQVEEQERMKKPTARDLASELKEAVEKNDYEKMAKLKEEGYKPSEEVIKGLGQEVHIDSKQAIVIEKLFGTKPEVEVQKEEEIVQKKEENIENVNKAEKMSSPELDKEFKNAVEKGDFVKLSQLKEQGYHPSKEVMQSLSNTTPSNTIIAVQKIFGLKAVSNTMGDVKLAHGQQSTDRDLKRPIANTINRMFSDL
ncbi:MULTISPECIES: DUF3945 domain-containing protein [Bacteroidaceae]|jgi:hypothetical protein|uniref:DUF3945 domain-containing protein n=1 Tax=Bacteroidaceae TaxID=815 RepID=UPI001C38D170|nr:DUF3945 domain-containing protein [Phocaeicola vulgatus]MBV4188154.1 DUF3945 domain-containing protein [Phocaeicola vulgatus]MCF2697200.1 DUF3945 domain-containing protein [Phocaeicola vulgatus]